MCISLRSLPSFFPYVGYRSVVIAGHDPSLRDLRRLSHSLKILRKSVLLAVSFFNPVMLMALRRQGPPLFLGRIDPPTAFSQQRSQFSSVFLLPAQDVSE